MPSRKRLSRQKRALSISHLHPAGEGVGEADGWQVRVRDALPGEAITAEITAWSQHRPEAFARLLSVDTPSPERVTPRCAHFGSCGGCDLQHLLYRAQVREKRRFVERALGEHPELSGVTVEPCEESPDTFGYRYAAKWVVRRIKGEVLLGAYARRSHEVVSTAGCPVHRPPLEELGRVLREELSRAPEIPLGEEGLRYLVARESRATGEIALVLIVSSFFSGLQAFAERVAAKARLVGVLGHQNERKGDALFAPEGEDRVLWGRGEILERVGEVLVPVSPRSFLQINAPQAERLREAAFALAAAREEEVVIDLFAGAGALSLPLARRAKEVVAIERSLAAVKAARLAAARAGVSNLEVRQGDAAEELLRQSRADLIVLNPPRAGASEALLAAVVALLPSRIVYISCSPRTLARDAAYFVRAGYRLDVVKPFDLFPQTTHVEVVARFVIG